MKIAKQKIILIFFLILVIVVIGFWIGHGNSIQKTPESNPGYQSNPGIAVTPVQMLSGIHTLAEPGPGYQRNPESPVTPVQTPPCYGNQDPVPAGGDVYIGEGCLDVSAGVSSEQVISWYKPGRNCGNATPDARRIVHNA
jgi:hypothetical protein